MAEFQRSTEDIVDEMKMRNSVEKKGIAGVKLKTGTEINSFRPLKMFNLTLAETFERSYLKGWSNSVS